jgi:hypothetical protein
MVNPKSYDTNRIIRDMANLRGSVGSLSTIPPWTTITLDGTWVTLSGYAPPSYRLWQDGVHLELTGLADWGSSSTVTQNLNGSNPLPFAPLTIKTIFPTAGNENVGTRGFIQISPSGVITMNCSSSFTGRYAEINSIIPLDL